MTIGGSHASNEDLELTPQEIREELEQVEYDLKYVRRVRGMGLSEAATRELAEREQELQKRRDELTAPVARTFGSGSVTLTYYRASGRIGVTQRGDNAVMDLNELLSFVQEVLGIRLKFGAPKCGPL